MVKNLNLRILIQINNLAIHRNYDQNRQFDHKSKIWLKIKILLKIILIKKHRSWTAHPQTTKFQFLRIPFTVTLVNWKWPSSILYMWCKSEIPRYYHKKQFVFNSMDSTEQNKPETRLYPDNAVWCKRHKNYGIEHNY